MSAAFVFARLTAVPVLYYTVIRMSTKSAQPISVRMSEKDRKALDRIAKAQNRDRSYIINEAVRNYLELQEWQIAKIKQGLKEADAGEFVSDEEARALFKV